MSVIPVMEVVIKYVTMLLVVITVVVKLVTYSIQMEPPA